MAKGPGGHSPAASCCSCLKRRGSRQLRLLSIAFGWFIKGWRKCGLVMAGTGEENTARPLSHFELASHLLLAVLRWVCGEYYGVMVRIDNLPLMQEWENVDHRRL